MAAFEWPVCDPATVAPLLKGRPHMYANMPSRFVTLAESKFRGWSYFYIGDVCKKGHKAPRFVSNPSACVDCDRQRSGMQTIGGKGAVETHIVQRARKEDPNGERTAEPTKRQKDFLASYAESKDFDTAAKKVNVSPAVIEGELSWSAVFRDAYDALEERTGLRHIVAYDLDYEWDEDKRSMFIRMFVDTGDKGTARDAIRVTPYEFEAECKRNPEFATRVAEAEPLADKIVIERIRRGAIEGNPQLLIGAMKQLDLDVPDDPAAGKTCEQLTDEIIRTLGLAKRDANAGAVVRHEPAADVSVSAVVSADVPDSVEDDFSDIL